MTHPPTFVRHELRRNLVVSTCVLCHRTVASSSERLLRVAEAAHSCPKLRYEDREPARSAGWQARDAK